MSKNKFIRLVRAFGSFIYNLNESNFFPICSDGQLARVSCNRQQSLTDMYMPEFHFEPDITLANAPLVEAWITLRWKLEELQSGSSVFRDIRFPFALGRFYESIKDEFGHRVELQASKAPIEIMAYRPHYQFMEASEKQWPLIQLGPGIASLNFTKPYTWTVFRKRALYLRLKLLQAYEYELRPESLSLQYRNAFPCEYSTENILKFFESSLNTQIRMPPYVPGDAAAKGSPSEVNFRSVYDLREPKAKGVVHFITAEKNEPLRGQQRTAEVVLLDLEVTSFGDDCPDFENEDTFEQWLTSAHNVTHDWFFSFIEGRLLDVYRGRK